MKQLNQKQLEHLRQCLEEFWQIFVEADAGLRSSHCSCCEKKRQLLKEIDALAE